MKTALLIVGSFTQANKGRVYLSGLNIKSRVEKSTGAKNGCAYGIRVYDDPEKASRLLGTVGIEVKRIVGG